MKNGICPKCDFKEVYRLGKRRTTGISTMNISSVSRALLYNYVCTRCGYVESYVTDRKDLERIVKKGEKISPK